MSSPWSSSGCAYRRTNSPTPSGPTRKSTRLNAPVTLKLGPRIRRIRKLLRFWSAHGHYKCLHQRLCTDEELKLSKGALRERLAEEQSRLRMQTREPSLHVEPLHLHYGHPSDKGRYPLNDICFFDKSDSKDNEVQPGPPAHLGRSRINGPFEDKYVRFYARDVDLCQDKVRLCRLQQMVKQQLDQGEARVGTRARAGAAAVTTAPTRPTRRSPGAPVSSTLNDGSQIQYSLNQCVF